MQGKFEVVCRQEEVFWLSRTDDSGSDEMDIAFAVLPYDVVQGDKTWGALSLPLRAAEASDYFWN